MTMLPKINLPDYQPRWATDSARTLEPAETEKDNGWDDDDKPPARWMNWLQNLAYTWTQRVGASVVGNISLHNTLITGGAGIDSIIFHPTLIGAGIWLCHDATDVYSSIDGRNWGLSVRTLAASGRLRSRAIDSTYAMFGLFNGSIDYTSDGSSTWANDSGMTTTAQILALASKYPDSDFLMLGDSNGDIEIASGGIGTSWVTATTQPSFSSVNALCRVGSTSWVAMSGSATTEISTDDGDNWADTATDPSDTTQLGNSSHMAYDADNNVLICCGDDGAGNAMLARSADLGTVWTEPTIVDGESITKFDAIYYCGGGIWFTHGELESPARGNGAGHVSFDGGVTWYPAAYINEGTIAKSNINDIGCNGSMLVMVREDGRAACTLAVPGSMNG